MRLLALLFIALTAQGADRLTLEEAQKRALAGNHALKLARLKAGESAERRAAARADFFPKVLMDANYFYFTKPLGTTLNLGGMGILPPPLPSIPVPLDVVRQNFFFGGVGVGQPLTQMFKIRAGVDAAASEEGAAKAVIEKAKHEVAYAVEQLYYGLLISERQRVAAQLKVAAAEELLRDAQNAVEAGKALPVASLGRRAQVLESKQTLLAVEMQSADYAEALNNLMGSPASVRWELVEPERPQQSIQSPEEAIQMAVKLSPEVREAEQTRSRASAGVRAAQADYIPDVTAFFTYYHQTGISAMPHDFGAAGGRLSYTLFDFGKRRAQVKERQFLFEQAEENLRRVRDQLEVDVRKNFRAVERSAGMLNVAREAAALRKESERLSKDQFELGLADQASYMDAQAARASAEADLLRAEVGWRLAWAELRKTVGMQ